jgi:glycosyltransferase involved in cell wall biosynthesis
VPQRLHTLGYASDERLLAAAYSAADVTLAPSTVENLSNSILESMACGTPVVAYDSGGIGDAVRHDETGWLAPARDPTALAEGIARLLGDEPVRRRLAEAGLALVDSTFTAEREVRAFAALYATLAEERRTAAAA